LNTLGPTVIASALNGDGAIATRLVSVMLGALKSGLVVMVVVLLLLLTSWSSQSGELNAVNVSAPREVAGWFAVRPAVPVALFTPAKNAAMSAALIWACCCGVNGAACGVTATGPDERRHRRSKGSRRVVDA